MTRKQLAHLFGLVAPPLALVPALLVVSAGDVALLAGMYLATGFGITVGFHRLLTHRSFATHRPLAYALAGLGSMALQGSVIDWVADHRKHHAHSDRPGDPHSPNLDDGVLRSLWHAHLGWLFRNQGRAEHARYAPDLLEGRGMRAIDRLFVVFVGLSFAIPFAIGGLSGLLWGGFVRIFLFHHATFSINSVCHFFGRRRFGVDDRSGNVAWLAPFSLGESWHHNHHAFPRSAAHGLRWWELDLSGLLIRGLRRLGLAWNVVLISPERQLQRLASIESGP
ncbi:MAG: acyl-CoA desaturase [Thermoleophilaceae bacterium]